MQRGLKLKQVLNLIEIPKSTFYYKNKARKDDIILSEKIKNIAYKYIFYGYRRIHQVLLKQNIKVNHKRVYRLYCAMNLQKHVKKKKNKLKTHKKSNYTFLKPEYKNHIWSLDFIYVTLSTGKRVKLLTVEDVYTRKGLKVFAKFSITSSDVVTVVDELIKKYGKPEILKTDNGPEFISNLFVKYLEHKRIKHDRVPAGSPYFNGTNERFNKTLKYELYFVEYIESLKELEILTNKYLKFYNRERPHQALNYKCPDEIYYG